jgi:thiol-disulfide isomerase/thioredoxin
MEALLRMAEPLPQGQCRHCSPTGRKKPLCGEREFLVRLLLIACLTAPLGFAQETAYLCQPRAEVAQALAALPLPDDPNLTWEERIGPVRALLKRYSDDLFVHLHYQDMFLRTYWLADEFDRALALYREMPDKTMSQYLEARLLWRSQARRSRETLEHLVETMPQFPWPHLALVEMTEMPGNADSVSAETHLRSFLKACPNTLEAYAHFQNVKDPELIHAGAGQLRQLLSVRSDAMVWRYYPDLWGLEFRDAPKEEHDKVRQRVRDDMKRLQTLQPVASNYWYRTFKQASELAQDPSIRGWTNETVLSKLPHSQLALDITEERWYQEHAAPSSAKREDYKKWDQQCYEATEEWLKRWPKGPSLIAERFRYVHSLPELPNEKALAILDDYAELRASRPDFAISSPPISIIAAEEYVKRKVRLDRVPKMIEAGLREADLQQKYQLDPELLPGEAHEWRVDWLAFARYRANIILADLYLLTDETSKAQDVLTQVGAELEARKPGSTASPREQREYPYHRSEYLRRLAHLEEKEGRPQDALTHYQEVLLQSPRRVVEEEKEDYVRAAKQLYLKQGGTLQDWLAWATSPEKASHTEPVLAFSAPLPDFRIEDLHGRTWQLSDLKGRVTLLDFWATWCGACRSELPYIQKLYDRVKDRKDLQVVTISVDDNPGLIEGYLKETGFTFPVLVAKDLAEKIFPVLMLPQTWIIDPQGSRSRDQVVGASDDWVTSTISRMEMVRREVH